MPNVQSYRVILKAKTSNTGNIYVGNNLVSSSTGLILTAGESADFLVSNANILYLDADTNGEGITYLIEVRV
jgi:hypothetical protein